MNRPNSVRTTLLFLAASTAFAQSGKPDKLFWHDNYEAARKEAQVTGKPIFVEFRCAP